MPFILALDQGTTSSRAMVFDQEGSIVAAAQKEFGQIFPRPGWVEHDPREILSSQIGVAVEALLRAGVRPRDIAAVGIANQRETAVVWDRRTASFCDQLRSESCETLIQERTGLVLDAYFSASKVAWILENVAGARRRADSGELAFGTVDSWLAWNLTGGRCHVTDASNASRTMLFNIHTGAWDTELLKLFRIPESMLPQVCPSSHVHGEIATTLGLGGVPLAGIAGDQQAALFGQMCLTPGLTKCTYGTGCFMLQNTGGQAEFALEGSVFIGGAAVQWLRDGLGLITSAAGIEALAGSVPDNGGVYFVPALSGLGAPHWDPYARGAILGITRGTRAAPRPTTCFSSSRRIC